MLLEEGTIIAPGHIGVVLACKALGRIGGGFGM
jgi:hypothetical protein